MKEILKYENKQLIVKYENFYIRFIGGQYVELPCDIKITKAEAEKIIEKPHTIIEIFDNYRKNKPWSLAVFMREGLEDYLKNEENCSSEESEEILNILDKYENIKYEMYESIMMNQFPVSGLVQICGKTAKDIGEEKNQSVGKAYLALLKLAEKE